MVRKRRLKSDTKARGHETETLVLRARYAIHHVIYDTNFLVLYRDN